MELSKFIGPYFSLKDSDDLKEFHKNKLYIEDITYDTKLRNLKYFWDYTSQNLTRVGTSAQEVFSSLQYEGYLKTCIENLEIVKNNPEDQDAFTNYQVAGMFILKHDFSCFNTHFTQSEVSIMKKQVEESFINFLKDTSISRDRRCIIADCLILASCSEEVKQLASYVISSTRGINHQVQVGLLQPGPRFNELVAPEATRPKGVKDISTDSQNVHSSNISSVVKRKLLILEKDQIPSKKDFKSSITSCKKLRGNQKDQSNTDQTNEKNSDMMNVKIYFGTKQINLSTLFRTDTDHIKIVTNPDIIQYLRKKNHVYNHPDQTEVYDKNVDTKISTTDWFVPQTLEDVEVVAMKLFKELFNHTKKIEAFSRIATDTVVFTPSKLKLSDVFQYIFNRVISQYNKDYFPDLVQRVFEELQDSAGVCATGYVSRLLNILQGYSEIDIEVVDSYEEDIFKEIQTYFDLKMQEYKKYGKENEAEDIEDGLISFDPEERKPFETFFNKIIMEWYLQMFDKFVNNLQVYSSEWFDEDFSKMVFKFSAMSIKPQQFTDYRKSKNKDSNKDHHGDGILGRIGRLIGLD